MTASRTTRKHTQNYKAGKAHEEAQGQTQFQLSGCLVYETQFLYKKKKRLPLESHLDSERRRTGTDSTEQLWRCYFQSTSFTLSAFFKGHCLCTVAAERSWLLLRTYLFCVRECQQRMKIKGQISGCSSPDPQPIGSSTVSDVPVSSHSLGVCLDCLNTNLCQIMHQSTTSI